MRREAIYTQMFGELVIKIIFINVSVFRYHRTIELSSKVSNEVLREPDKEE